MGGTNTHYTISAEDAASHLSGTPKSKQVPIAWKVLETKRIVHQCICCALPSCSSARVMKVEDTFLDKDLSDDLKLEIEKDVPLYIGNGRSFCILVCTS